MFLYLLMCNYDLAIIMCINFTVNILIKAQSKNNCNPMRAPSLEGKKLLRGALFREAPSN